MRAHTENLWLCTCTNTHTHTYSNHSAETCAGGSGEEAERRVKRLKWERMTAGAAVWCRGLTAAWTEATLTNWANLAAREEKESQRTKWLLFSSSLSPHLNSLSLSPTLPSFPTHWLNHLFSVSLSLRLTLITTPHPPIKAEMSHLKVPGCQSCASPFHMSVGKH